MKSLDSGNHPTKIALSIATVLLIGAGFLFVALVYLPRYIESEIEREIFAFQGKTTGVVANLFTRSLQVNNLEWGEGTDSIHSTHHVVELQTVTLTKINLAALLLRKVIQVEEVIIDSGRMHYNSSIKPDEKKRVQPVYNLLSFKSIRLKSIHLQIKADTLVSFSATLNGQVTDVRIEIDSVNTVQYTLKTVDALAEEINLSRHEGMYGGTIARLQINSETQKVVIDSILLIPNFSKYAFARVADEQTDRISVAVPKVIMEGVQFKELADRAFVVARIEVKSLDLYSFRDKRIPFTRIKNMPLPMAGFIKLPWRIQIDSVYITDARIQVEEFAPTAIESGTLTFNAIEATLAGLNNRLKTDSPSHAVLKATGLLMGAGRIHALFQLPLDGSLTYHAQGSISKMNFEHLNPFLTPLANIHIKTGHLNKLTFDFNYNELTSKGRLDMDYEDLRVTWLNTNKESRNEFKSLMLNAVIKTNRKQSRMSSQRSGTINIERDRKRSIFNLWGKSVMDGLKSSITDRRQERVKK